MLSYVENLELVGCCPIKLALLLSSATYLTFQFCSSIHYYDLCD